MNALLWLLRQVAFAVFLSVTLVAAVLAYTIAADSGWPVALRIILVLAVIGLPSACYVLWPRKGRDSCPRHTAC